jgi:sulfur relay (sulfurtransferase) DsrC/TusE family protein
MRLEIETLVQYKNVHLFAFFDETELTCNLDNYKDAGHYGEWINSKILQWMAEGKHQLTTENYEVYCDFVEDFYANYDYDALFVN